MRIEKFELWRLLHYVIEALPTPCQLIMLVERKGVDRLNIQNQHARKHSSWGREDFTYEEYLDESFTMCCMKRSVKID